MADPEDTNAETSAEKAYAAAAEAAAEKVDPATGSAEPVEFPAKAKRARKAPAAAEAAPVTEALPAPETAPGVESAPVVAAAPAPQPAPVVEPAPAVDPAPKSRRPRGAAKPGLAVKRAVAKPTPVKAAPARPVSAKVAPIAGRRPAVQKIKTAPKAAKTDSTSVAPHRPFIAQLKEIPMDVTNTISDAVSGAQEKAKETFTKTSAAASAYGEFAKGNVEACVESGKILASGLQELGNKLIADSKAAFETVTADMKALGGVKSPTDLFKLQSEILRRNFDTAIAYGSKNSEAMLKLTNEVIAPLSGRVTLAVEKLKKAA